MSDPRKGLPSASRSIRYLCLGQFNLERALRSKDMISDDLSPAAQSGTRVHAVRAGELLELDGREQDMAERLREMERRTCDQIFGGAEFGYVGIFREKRFWLRDGIRPIFSGQADWGYRGQDDGTIVIGDDKTGRIEVSPAERNYQLRDLAALYYENDPDCNRVFVVIQQPWISRDPSIARYDQDAVQQAVADLRTNLRQVADPDAPRTPGPHCRYCPCHPWCEEAKRYADGPRGLLERIEHGEVTLPLGQQGSDILHQIDVGYRILDRLWALYEKAVQADPDAIPDWWIEPGDERRKITNREEVISILLAHGLRKAQIEEALELSIGKLEKHFCNRSGMKQRDAKRAFNILLADCIKRTQNKGTLKPRPQRGPKST